MVKHFNKSKNYTMKKNFRHLSVLLATFMLFTLFSCSLDDGVDGVELPDEFTVNQIVVFSDFLTLLEEAINLAGLDDLLEGNGEFTLFAPSDAALQEFLDGTQLSDIPTEDLRQLLLNHIVPGTIRAEELNTLGSGYVNTLSTAGPDSNNLSLYFNTEGGISLNGGVDNGGALVINGLTNSQATNGIVHIINDVIELPNIVTFAAADPNFSTLVSALTTDGLTNDFISILSSSNGSAFSTVFAPVNTAFEALVTELDGINELGDLAVATLETVLTYHVSQPFNIRAEDLTSGQVVSTLNGDTFTVSFPADAPIITDVNTRATNIIVINVQATNGVIHGIDRVLLPTLE